MAREPANSLDDPAYWRDFVRRALSCPMGAADSYTEYLAQCDGINPRRAVAMLATFYLPADTPATVH
jgi:hypothetical protein